MTVPDAKIIFGNVAEIALFADELSFELEEALGSVLVGGEGDDKVGELFLNLTLEAVNAKHVSSPEMLLPARLRGRCGRAAGV